MKYLAILAVAINLLLTGCATIIRSDVTAFHEWPAGLHDKSYVFAAPPAREDSLEYRSYQNLVRAELAKLGFVEAPKADAAKLKVSMRFSTIGRPVRVIETIDPYWPGPGYWPGGYGYRGPWAYHPFYGYGHFRPNYYDPFMYGPAEMRETIRHNYERYLRVSINSTSGTKLFDVTVHNTSSKASTPAVMPALVASAFAGFPGQSGVPRRVDLKVE